MDTMDKFFTEKKCGISAQEAGRSQRSISKGIVERKIYGNYYDLNNTITTAQAADPHDEDHPNYNREAVFESLERNAEKITVCNDGSDTLFVIVSHEGGQNFVRERPIYVGENKTFWNVYELRLRSPTAGTAYRVTEYCICCNDTTGSHTVVPQSNPMIQGTKSDVSTVASAMVAVATPIFKCITIKLRSLLGGASYVGLGDSTGQPFRLINENDSITIDFTSDLSNIYAITDNGTAVLEYIGG